ncbi:MAG TPA: hypothetical protein VK502_00945 [Candidatus Saccharimonadales bacterium]|nr:hypothetical protein [Candidatus Saccharimonadales bacterium]
MNKLIRVENRETLSLENDGLNVHRGWDEKLARQFAQLAHRQMPIARSPRSLEASVEALNLWDSDKRPEVYSLGRQATLLAVAHFLLNPSPETKAPYEFVANLGSPQIDDDQARSFFAASHYDFSQHSRYEGPIYAQVQEGDPLRKIYEANGYRVKQRESDTLLLVRKGMQKKGVA